MLNWVDSMKNYVILKGKKDRLEIQLNGEVDFITLRNSMIEKMKEAKNFIGEGKMAIEFTGRDLSELEENVLIDLIRLHSNLNIVYVFSGEKIKEVNRFSLFHSISEEGSTKFFRGTLRSGSKLEYDGNLVILGDVNPGSLIKASGNVLVLGHLNGTVYAGIEDSNNSFVAAMFLNPVKLIIGNKVSKVLQKEILDTNRVKKGSFQIAQVKQGEIVIEEWR